MGRALPWQQAASAATGPKIAATGKTRQNKLRTENAQTALPKTGLLQDGDEAYEMVVEDLEMVAFEFVQSALAGKWQSRREAMIPPARKEETSSALDKLLDATSKLQPIQVVRRESSYQSQLNMIDHDTLDACRRNDSNIPISSKSKPASNSFQSTPKAEELHVKSGVSANTQRFRQASSRDTSEAPRPAETSNTYDPFLPARKKTGVSLASLLNRQAPSLPLYNIKRPLAKSAEAPAKKLASAKDRYGFS